MLSKLAAVPRDRKEYRRALQLVSSPGTAYHGTDLSGLRGILRDGKIQANKGVYGHGVYHSVGLPAEGYFNYSNGAIAQPQVRGAAVVPQVLMPESSATRVSDFLRAVNETPKWRLDKLYGTARSFNDSMQNDLAEARKNTSHAWTRTSGDQPLSRGQTVISPNRRSDLYGVEEASLRENRLRFISGETFRKAMYATHPSAAPKYEAPDLSERARAKKPVYLPGGNSAVGERARSILSDPAARAKLVAPDFTDNLLGRASINPFVQAFASAHGIDPRRSYLNLKSKLGDIGSILARRGR